MSITPDYTTFAKEQKDFIKSMKKQQFRINQEDYSYTMIKYWDSLNVLLTKPKNKKSWRKYNHVELVWLRIIKILRNYGLDIDKVLKVKEYIFEDKKEKNKLEYIIWLTFNSGMATHLYVLPDGNSFIDEKEGFFTRSESYLTVNLREIIKQEVKI